MVFKCGSVLCPALRRQHPFHPLGPPAQGPEEMVDARASRASPAVGPWAVRKGTWRGRDWERQSGKAANGGERLGGEIIWEECLDESKTEPRNTSTNPLEILDKAAKIRDKTKNMRNKITANSN